MPTPTNAPSPAAAPATATSPRPILDPALWRERIFDGGWVAARGGAIDVIEPAAGTPLTRVGVGNALDVAHAARAAARAQPGWARVPARERAELLQRAAACLGDHAGELAAFIARETGGTSARAQHEVCEAMAQLKTAAGMILQPEGVVLPSTPGRVSIARRVPLGVVGIISPFDFPLILSMRSLAPALAAGNAVVLQPDAQTPVTGGFLPAIAFQAAGLPRGVLQVVPGEAEACDALCSDPSVQMISFTGSTAAGRRASELAGKHLKKIVLELGGTSSLIILDDADLELAATNVAWGAHLHRGQLCMRTGRVLVHEQVATALTQRLADRARQFPAPGPGRGNVALGPLMSERHRDRVHAIVTQTIVEGAKLEAGGSFDGLLYAPTVLSAVRPEMRAFREESCGPVASIVRFASDDEAVALANDAEYGPSAAVISNSIGRATAIAERLHASVVHVNAQAPNDDAYPSGGGDSSACASGNPTHRGGPADIDEYTQWRWMTIDDSARPYPF
jgi:benzaldehyde dehydrogenase (NAD)